MHLLRQLLSRAVYDYVELSRHNAGAAATRTFGASQEYPRGVRCLRSY